MKTLQAALMLLLSWMATEAEAAAGLRQANTTMRHLLDQRDNNNKEHIAVRRRQLQGPDDRNKNDGPGASSKGGPGADEQQLDKDPPRTDSPSASSSSSTTEEPTTVPPPFTDLTAEPTFLDTPSNDDNDKREDDDDKADTKDERPSSGKNDEDIDDDDDDDDDDSYDTWISDKNDKSTTTSSTTNCSEPTSAQLWLEVTFEVLAVNAKRSLVLGDSVVDLVETRLINQLGVDSYAIAVSSTTTTHTSQAEEGTKDYQFSVWNKTAAASSSCPIQLTDMSLFAPSITGLPCTGIYSMALEKNTSMNNASACFQMASILRMTYDGPSMERDAALQGVMQVMPDAFENLTAVKVDFVEAAAFVPDITADTMTGSSPETPNDNTSAVSQSSRQSRKPTGTIVMSMAGIMAVVALVAGIVTRHRRKRQPPPNLVDRIKIMSNQRTLNVSVDNVRLQEETFHDDSFDTGASTPRSTPEKRRSPIHATDDDLEVLESFEVDEQGRMFQHQEYVVRVLGRSSMISDTVAL